MRECGWGCLAAAVNFLPLRYRPGLNFQGAVDESRKDGTDLS
jgi:hypothetical protein